MDKLIKVIGPAPSELLIEEFMTTRLIPERARVLAELQAFRAGPKAKPTTRSRATKKEVQELGKKLAEAGITPEQLMAKIKEKTNANR